MKPWTEPPSWLAWDSVKWLRNPNVQLRLGAGGLALTTVSWWPVWHFLGGPAGEPPVVFHLSYFAIWLSFLTIVLVTDVGETVK